MQLCIGAWVSLVSYLPSIKLGISKWCMTVILSIVIDNRKKGTLIMKLRPVILYIGFIAACAVATTILSIEMYQVGPWFT